MGRLPSVSHTKMSWTKYVTGLEGRAPMHTLRQIFGSVQLKYFFHKLPNAVIVTVVLCWWGRGAHQDKPFEEHSGGILQKMRTHIPSYPTIPLLGVEGLSRTWGQV